jgi:uncharacterized protein involved in exopolysaccharide biosynthesis
MEQKNQGFQFSSEGIISFILKWWKHILIVSFIGLVSSLLISFTIKNKYKSVVIFYPTTTNSISKALLETSPGGKQDFLAFGEEEQAEQSLQILQSDEIRDWVIINYDLYNHYKINPKGKDSKTKIFKEYNGNVSFRRNEFNAVEITVLDTDPLKAAGMANDIAARHDTIKNKIQKERAREGFKIVEMEYNRLNAEIKVMTDSLDKIRALGVNDYISMAEVLNRAYAEALAKGNQSGANAVKQQIDILSKYGGTYMELTENLELFLKQRAEVKVKYDQAKIDAESNIPHKMVVNYAYAADKKTYPKRMYITLGGGFATFCMSIFFIIGLENWRRYKASAKLSNNNSPLP